MKPKGMIAPKNGDVKMLKSANKPKAGGKTKVVSKPGPGSSGKKG